jgi:hypothetical protein
MALLSPSDLVWIIGFTPQGRWIAPIMRAAVRAEWPLAKHMAEAQLGEVDRAHELMEIAIQEVKDQLADSTPLEVDHVRVLLRRCYSNAIRRELRAKSRLAYRARAPVSGRVPVAKFIASFASHFWMGMTVDWVETNGQAAVLISRDRVPIALSTIDASAQGIDRIMWIMRPSKLAAISGTRGTIQ